jgi:ElaB/YqjD/DUF883 family membrane-anchored ribosome-binding protein
MTEAQMTRESLMKDVKEVVADTEELLKSVGATGSEKVQALRAGIEQNLRSAKSRLRDLEQDARQRGRKAVRATDDYVHENPWQSMAAAAGVGAVVGVLVGLLLNRRA